MIRAHSRLDVVPSGEDGTRTRIARMRSDPPLVLRPTSTAAVPVRRWDLRGAAQVAVATGAAGPVGGDVWRQDVRIQPGAALIVRSVAATLVLPGPHGDSSRSEVTIRVAADGLLVWLPEPLIAGRGCDHHGVTHIDLEPGARLLVREELILGRYGESPGTVRQRLRVTLQDQPHHDQELVVGPEVHGFAGPAVTGGRKALGSLLLVDPDLDTSANEHGGEPTDSETAVMSLDRNTMLVSTLAHDALTVRQRLDHHLSGLVREAAGGQRGDLGG